MSPKAGQERGQPCPRVREKSGQHADKAVRAPNCDKRDGDWLLILGFAFERGITELSRSFGNFRVRIIRMHDDQENL